MTDPLKKLAHDMKSVRLTEPEKASMRGELLHFMKENPAVERASQKIVDPSEESTSWFGSFLLFLVPRPMPVLAALMIIAVSGGSISFAAEGTLPGDFLYPVKVSVNEEVTALFKVSEADKLQWEIKRSERRLAEANLLKQRGTLSDSALARLSEGIEKHDSSIEKLENKLQMNGQNAELIALQAEYEAKLTLYQDVLFEVLSEKRMVAAVAPTQPELPLLPISNPETPLNNEIEVSEPIHAPVIRPTFSSINSANNETEPSLTDFVREFRQPQPIADVVPFVNEMRDAKDPSFDSKPIITPVPTPVPDPTPVNPQAEWADRAKSQRIITEESYSKNSNYLDGLIQTWGPKPFNSVSDQFSSAKAALSKGQSFYNEGTYQSAYNSFMESFKLIDQATNEAINIESNLVADQKAQQTQLISDTRDMAKYTAERLTEITTILDDAIQTTGKDLMAGPLKTVEQANILYIEGQARLSRQEFDMAYDQFKQAFLLLENMEDEINHLLSEFKNQTEAGFGVAPDEKTDSPR